MSGGLTEAYTYDADGARVTRSATPGLSTRFAFGLYELEGSVTRSYYALAGQVVAVRDSGLGLSYLYGDHLGSISVSTSATGQRQGVQYVDAWGKKLSGTVSQTKRSYTGQYLDDSGLLFYNARYYDPGMGRFVSADSIVPGNASGGMAGIAYKPLTVDVHEPGFVAKIAQENQFGPWYLLSDKEKQQVGAPWGPANPQALNRYAYVLNNPMRWTDPGGHTWYMSSTQAHNLEKALRDFATELGNPSNGMTVASAIGIVIGIIAKIAGLGTAAAAVLVADAIAAVTGAAGIIVTLLTLAHVASVVTALADLIDAANLPAANGMAYGVALQFMNGTLLAMNRGTGAVLSLIHI